MTSQNATRSTSTTSSPAHHDRTEPSTIIDTAMLAVDRRIIEVTQSDIDILREASQHILGAGGKRVRPRLVLLGFMACGGNDIKTVISAAAALELVHTASVVHDDINDHGVVRRGRPSVNQIWGRTFALLTGDYLFTKVYELMLPYDTELNTVFSEATTALVEGETLQAAAVKENKFTREVYMDIIARKTAALFKAGAIIGASLADAEEEVIAALGRYGYNVGLAFQIIDDILDIVGDETKLGKTAGIDTGQGKGFTSIGGTNNGGSEDPFEAIKAKALAGDRINEARMQAQHLVNMAIAELDVLPNSEAKRNMIELAHQIVNRDH